MFPFTRRPKSYAHLVTRHLIHNGKEYRITHVGNDNDYVQCQEINTVTNKALRLPIRTALNQLKDRG